MFRLGKRSNSADPAALTAIRAGNAENLKTPSDATHNGEAAPHRQGYARLCGDYTPPGGMKAHHR
jgi:hypothetical protein